MNKAIGFVMVGTNDLEKSSKFYDSILVHLGMKRVTITERYIGYGHSSKDEVLRSVMHELNITSPPRPDDAADALAIALTGIYLK